MTALAMQKLATALLNEGYVVKKIEDEEKSSFDRKENGEQYTGNLIIKVRPIDDEEAEAEAARLRKEKERKKGVNSSSKPEDEEVKF